VPQHSPNKPRDEQNANDDAILLDDPRSVMENILNNVLHQNHGLSTRGDLSPLVENLTLLMIDLSRVAAVVVRKRQGIEIQ